MSKVKTFKRSADELDISFDRNFNNLMIFLGLNVIFIAFLGFWNSFYFYHCIFIRLLNVIIYEIFILYVINFRYRAPMETTRRAEWATLYK